MPPTRRQPAWRTYLAAFARQMPASRRRRRWEVLDELARQSRTEQHNDRETPED